MFLRHSTKWCLPILDSDWSECIEYFSVSEVSSIIQIKCLYSTCFSISVYQLAQGKRNRERSTNWASSFTLHANVSLLFQILQYSKFNQVKIFCLDIQHFLMKTLDMQVAFFARVYICVRGFYGSLQHMVRCACFTQIP